MTERPGEVTPPVRQTGASPAPRTTEETTPSTGQLITRASEQLSDLVRSEMQLARAELSAAAKHAGVGAGLFGVAGVVALYGVGALVATAVLALALVLDAWLAALIVAVVLFVVAGVAALVGKQQVSKAPADVSESVQSVKTDVDTVRRKDSR